MTNLQTFIAAALIIIVGAYFADGIEAATIAGCAVVFGASIGMLLRGPGGIDV